MIEMEDYICLKFGVAVAERQICCRGGWSVLLLRSFLSLKSSGAFP